MPNGATIDPDLSRSRVVAIAQKIRIYEGAARYDLARGVPCVVGR
ncbi:hypothetical protein [Rhodoflexus caldus]|nr:hypothetical protein [Rhodoflexus caldus]